MNEPHVPSRRQVGSQLALGVEGPGLFTTNGAPKWIQSQTDSAASKLLNLQLVEADDPMVVDTRRPYDCVPSADYDTASIGNQYFEDEHQHYHIDDQDYIVDSDDDELYDKVVMSRLRWGRLTPSFNASQLKLYKDVSGDNTKSNNSDSQMYPSHHTSHRKAIHTDYLPENIVSGMNNSDPIGIGANNDKIKIVDPSVGDIFVTGIIQTASDLRNDYENKIIAFSSGPSNSNIALRLLSNNMSRNSQSVIQNTVIFDLKSKIKSIKLPVLSATVARYPDYIGVITENSLVIIKFNSVEGKSGMINCSLYRPLMSNQFSDFQLADVTFNPWDMNQFAIIDAKGNWGIGYIPRNTQRDGDLLTLSPNNKGSIFNPEQLSPFKKIEWSSSDSRLLLVDSTRVTEIDFLHDWQSEVIEAVTWSEIRDFRKLDQNYSILLTSKEIIIVSTFYREDFKRVLSWKHDLDATNKTYKLAIEKLKFYNSHLIIAIVYSMTHSNVYLHCFLFEGRTVKSFDNENVLSPPNALSGIKTMSSMETEMGDYLDGNSEELAVNVYIQFIGSPMISRYSLKTGRYTCPKYDMTLEQWNQEDKDLLKKLQEHSLKEKQIASHIMDTKEIDPPEGYNVSKDDEVLEEYGYALSEAMNKIIQNKKTEAHTVTETTGLLKSLVNSSSYFENIEELSSLLEQFMKYYGGQGIQFNELSSLFSILLNEPVPDIDIFFNKILQCWVTTGNKSEHFTREFVKDLVLGYVRYYESDRLREKSEEQKKSLDQSYKEIFDSWDETESVEADTVTSSISINKNQHQFPSQNSQAQIPTIVSSQKSRSKRSRKTPSTNKFNPQFSQRKEDSLSYETKSSQLASTLPNNMTPAFSLMQPPMLSSPIPSSLPSQNKSSHKPKKKKKRKVGGFG